MVFCPLPDDHCEKNRVKVVRLKACSYPLVIKIEDLGLLERWIGAVMKIKQLPSHDELATS
jgi:hypothetical protein